MTFLMDLWQFLAIRKKYWLLPIIVGALLLGTVVVLSETMLAPFIYTLF